MKGKASKWWLYLPGAIAFGLGSWQIVRREEKVCASFSIQFNSFEFFRKNIVSHNICSHFTLSECMKFGIINFDDVKGE